MNFLFKRAVLFFVIILPFYLLGQDVPTWVAKRPVSNEERYVGRGDALSSKKNYLQKAERVALRSIAMEINTEISGTSRRFVTEINDISQSEFTNDFIVSTLANFQGLIKEEYTDPKTGRYYVLWSYPKKKHVENLEKSSRNAIELFNDYLRLESFEINNQLDKLVKCYEKLYFVYGNDVYIDVEGRKINLQNEVPYRIGDIIRRVELSSNSLFLKGVYNQSIDKPLKVKVNLFLPDPIGKTYGPNIPVEYFYKYGNGVFSDDKVYADEYGEAQTRIINVTDKIKTHQIVSRLNLKAYKSKDLEFGILDNALNKLSAPTELIFTIDVSMQKNDRIAIYVKSSQGIDYGTVLALNGNFEEAFGKVSDFELVDRTKADKILNSKGLTNADVCDNDECRIEIGKALQVDKFILIDLIYTPNSQEVSCSMRYADILKDINKAPKNYNTKVNPLDIKSTLRLQIPSWVREFYAILNPAKVTFTSNNTNARIYVDGKMYGYLPMIQEDFAQRKERYLFEFKATGYESKKRKINLNSNLFINEDIFMKRKTKFGAFSRSMLFPGLGQIYSAEENLENRKIVGYGLAATGIGLLAITMNSWSKFFDAKDIYDIEYDAYLAKTNLDEITEQRTVTEEKHSIMMDTENDALIISSILGGVWLLNALESILRFPDYELSDPSFGLYNDQYQGVSLRYSYYFK